MRKRIVIGLLAVVVMGAVAFFLSQPKRGSVEWHKREYLSASYGPPWRDWNLPFMLPDHSVARLQQHQRALIRLGYLEERTFIVPNAAVPRLSDAILRVVRKNGTWSEFDSMELSGTNGLRVVTLKGKMHRMEDVMRELEPEPAVRQ